MLAEDKPFWYKLGVDYDEVTKEKGDLLINLIKKFAEGKKQYIKEEDLDNLSKTNENELKEFLRKVYVRWLWDQKKSGRKFEYDNLADLQNQIKNDEKEGIIVEEVEDYRIIWKVEPEISVTADDKEWSAIGRKILKANPIILRIIKGSKLFELRGDKRNLKFCKEKFEKTGRIREVKPEIESKPIDRLLEDFIKKEQDDVELIGIKFLESNLPMRSKLVLTSETNIIHDLKELEEKEIVSTHSIATIKELHFKIKKLMKKVKVKIEQHEDSFVFKIDDRRLNDEEKEVTKRAIENSLHISFSKAYPFDVERDEKYIFDQILKGSPRFYEKYHDKLREELKSVLEKILDVENYELNRCKNCGYEFTGEECPNCGSKDFTFLKTAKLKIKEEEVFSFVYSLISDFLKNNTTISNGQVMYSEIKVSPKKKEKYIQLELLKQEVSKTKETRAFVSPKRLKFLLVPNCFRKPKRANEYLYPVIEIDLYNLFSLSKNVDKLKKEFIKLVENSLKVLEDRIVTLSNEARKRLGNLDIEKYTPKNFERDIFYLLKRMLPFTERWGRVGKRETDGIIVLATKDDNYSVISYDPKLNLNKEYYELSLQESSKAAFYILSENENDEIKSLTRGGGITSHLIISRKFDTKNIKNFVENVRKWYSLVKGKKSSFNVPIVFLDVDKLLKIYDIYKEYALLIKGHPEVQNKFIESIIELFSSKDGYKVIDEKDIEALRGMFISLKSEIGYKSPLSML